MWANERHRKRRVSRKASYGGPGAERDALRKEGGRTRWGRETRAPARDRIVNEVVPRGAGHVRG